MSDRPPDVDAHGLARWWEDLAARLDVLCRISEGRAGTTGGAAGVVLFTARATAERMAAAERRDAEAEARDFAERTGGTAEGRVVHFSDGVEIPGLGHLPIRSIQMQTASERDAGRAFEIEDV